LGQRIAKSFDDKVIATAYRHWRRTGEWPSLRTLSGALKSSLGEIITVAKERPIVRVDESTGTKQGDWLLKAVNDPATHRDWAAHRAEELKKKSRQKSAAG
jgi:hypothetical protein